MNFIYNFIPEEIIKAIGWTIFHSIWQGIIVAILLGTFLLLAGKKNSKLRYNISAVALFVMLIVSAITFYRYYEREHASESQTHALVYSSDTGTQFDNSEFSPLFEKPKLDLPGFVKAYFNEHLPLIVSLWLIGFLFFSLRFAGGLLYVRRLKYNGLNEINAGMLRRLKELADKINIRRVVQIFESAQVKVPVVIGHLKPMILLPLGLISGLPQEQFEAILIHELAHIKRYDFLINLFQSFIETVFFYHPVVWWISSTINSERENCCDDITIQISGDSLSYSKALYNLLQIHAKESELALAIIGKKNQLYRRIKRMNTKNHKTAYGIRFVAFALLLVAMAIVSVYSNSSANNGTRNLASAGFVNPFLLGDETAAGNLSAENNSLTPDTSSIKKGKKTIKFYDNENGQEKKFKAKLNNGKLEELYIDGDKVDDKDLSKYENEVAQKTDEYESLMEDYRENMKDFREKMKAYREKMKSLGFKHNHSFNFDFDFPPFPPDAFSSGMFDSTLQKEIMENVHKGLAEGLANLSTMPPIHIPPIHIPEMCIPPVDLGELREELKNLKFDTTAFRESMKEFKENMKNFKFDMKKFKEEMKETGPNSEAFKKSMAELKKNMGKLKKELKPLKGFWRETRDEMVKDNLIEPGEDIDSFTLSKDEMIIGGKKVSPELHKKYLGIYKKHYGKELTDDNKFQFEN